MADASAYPVLKAIFGLTRRNIDGKPAVIKTTDLAKASGISTKEVKKVLAENDAALIKNERGSLTGVKIVAYASDMGLIIHSRNIISGSSLFRQHFLKGKRVGDSYNLDMSDNLNKVLAAEEVLVAKHGVSICHAFNTLPDDVLAKVWKEDRR
jgi:hypothetical protein